MGRQAALRDLLGRFAGSHAGGVAALLLGTLLWSTAFVVNKVAIDSLLPSQIVLGRFAIAALCFLPWFRLGSGLGLAGAELGLWLVGGYGTQTVALLYTTAGRSAFIASLCVILVPLLLGLAGRAISTAAWVAVGLAAVGIALLSYQQGQINAGDLWSLVTALCWAIYIIRLEGFAARFSPLVLTAAQVSSISVLALGWAVLAAGSPPQPLLPATSPAWLWLIYLGLITTALPTWLQAIGQRQVSPPEAVIIFTLEPVVAAVLAFFWLGESLTIRQLVGAGLIIAATLVSQRPPPP